MAVSKSAFTAYLLRRYAALGHRDITGRIFGRRPGRIQRTHYLPPMPPLPPGPVLFTPGTAPAKKRRRIAFLFVYVAAILSLIWPGYAITARGEILGWPLALAWNVLWIGIMLGTLAVMYRADR